MNLEYFNMSETKLQKESDDKYRWDLTDLFQSDDEWQKNKDQLIENIKKIDQFKGTLNESGKQMYDTLNFVTNLQKELIRLYSYASMKSDQDTRVPKYLEMKQEMGQIFNEFSSAASFIDPEILKMDKVTIDNFLNDEKHLNIYEFYLHDLMRKKEHRGSKEEEKIIADAGLMSDNAQSIFNIFTNAEFPYPEVTLSDGDKIILNQANFSLYRASKNRQDREKIFEAFFNSLTKFKMTYGTQLYGNLKKDVFYKRARKYNSCLETALDANNIPKEVYHNLIRYVNENLTTFHRYLKLRKRMLNVDQLQYYDLYAPLVGKVDLKYNVEEAQNKILASLAPLGEEYSEIIKKAFDDRWIDMYPMDGKRSGAYSNGSAYDVHPYILMNFNGEYNDMSTLMHELGHTMHSYLSNKHQPYPLAGYPIFVAEVASTFNETLLNDHLLSQIENDETKLSILGNYLEGAKGTLFRQTQFAEFELAIHQMAEKGQALSGETFSEIYESITKKYYGHEQNICLVNDYIRSEWAYVPHFYYNFYVYQYATSFTAAQALVQKVYDDEKTRDNYLKFLSSGGSKYPIDLLKEAGIDMLSPDPFNLTIKKINDVMDQMEVLLDRIDQQ